jgi:hypothetical protein
MAQIPTFVASLHPLRGVTLTNQRNIGFAFWDDVRRFGQKVMEWYRVTKEEAFELYEAEEVIQRAIIELREAEACKAEAEQKRRAALREQERKSGKFTRCVYCGARKG